MKIVKKNYKKIAIISFIVIAVMALSAIAYSVTRPKPQVAVQPKPLSVATQEKVVATQSDPTSETTSVTQQPTSQVATQPVTEEPVAEKTPADDPILMNKVDQYIVNYVTSTSKSGCINSQFTDGTNPEVKVPCVMYFNAISRFRDAVKVRPGDFSESKYQQTIANDYAMLTTIKTIEEYNAAIAKIVNG